MKGGEDEMYFKEFPELRKEVLMLQRLGLEEYEIDYLINQRVKQIRGMRWEEN